MHELFFFFMPQGLFISNILFKKFTQFVCVVHNEFITALLVNVYGNFKRYKCYITNTLLV